MKRSLLLAAGVVAAVIGGMMFWEPQKDNHDTVAVAEPQAPEQAVADSLADLDPQQVEVEQLAANQAALDEIGEDPYQGPVKERPAFVSPLEWQVLKTVASRHPDSEQELTRLVNHLRFAKQWDLWEATDTRDSARRQALAKQLLEEIPSRVRNQELDPAYAQQMQQSLLADLVPDVQERRRRAAEEAARIGVKFQVESGS